MRRSARKLPLDVGAVALNALDDGTTPGAA